MIFGPLILQSKRMRPILQKYPAIYISYGSDQKYETYKIVSEKNAEWWFFLILHSAFCILRWYSFCVLHFTFLFGQKQRAGTVTRPGSCRIIL